MVWEYPSLLLMLRIWIGMIFERRQHTWCHREECSQQIEEEKLVSIRTPAKAGGLLHLDSTATRDAAVESTALAERADASGAIDKSPVPGECMPSKKHEI